MNWRAEKTCRGRWTIDCFRRAELLAAELEHPSDTHDIDHLDVERELAGPLDTLGAVLFAQREQAINAPHAGPRKRHVDKRLGETGGGGAMSSGLLDETRRIAVGVGSLFGREIGRIGRAPAGRLARMSLDQHATVVKAYGLRVGSCTKLPAAEGEDEMARQGIQRLGDLGVLIARHFGLGPQRHVIGLARRCDQLRAFDGIEMLARQALRTGMTAQAVFFETPASGMLAGVIDRQQTLAGKAIVAHVTDTSFDARFVLRVAHARDIDLESVRLNVVQKRLDQARAERIGIVDDRLRAVRNQDSEDPAVKLPRCLACRDRFWRALAKTWIDEAVARDDGREDEGPKPTPPSSLIRFQQAHPAGVDL